MMEQGHEGQLIVTHAKDVPDQIFVWDGEDDNLGERNDQDG